MSMLLEQFDTIFDTYESVTRLQEFILDMAVKGKLIPQDPNDEPTIELLRRIKIEKESLIRDKKIKKEKLISSIIEEKKLYELPKGWEWVRLNDIVELDDNSIRRGPFGSAVKKDMFVPKGVNTFKVYEQKNAIKKDCFIGDYYISQEKYDELKRFAVRSGDIIISCAGTIGETYLLPKESPPGIMNQALLKIRINNNAMLNRFFLLIFKALTQKKINETAKGSAMKNMTSVEYLKKEVLFALPSLNEQQRILEKVDQLMNFCEVLKKRLEKKQKREEGLNISAFSSLEQSLTPEELKRNLQFVITNFSSLCTDTKRVQQLRNAIVSLAVKGKLILQGSDDEPASTLLDKMKQEKEQLIKEKKIKKEKAFLPISKEEKLYKLPRGWEWVRLGEICKLVELGTSVKASTENIGVPVLRMNNIKKGKVALSNLKYLDKNVKDLPKLYLRHGDLLFNRTNSYELVGKTGVFEGINDEFTFASYLIRLRLMGNYVNYYYINYVINSNWYRISQIEPGIIQQNGQANFNGTKLKNTLIPLPPLNEQKRIVKKIDQLMTLCDKLENDITVFKQEKEHLLQSVLYQTFQQQNKEVQKA
ncbi:restriction endonuclease subunit S [Bacillus pseudomycoides]|uniref:restriction endonuclease subunit S n=1 Tax=Bacillus pseudomycoides TaxID=64104 RepID=UPI000BFE3FC7|nr:restriction endonuclease subunit S [Bacillus pseudomycoides]PHE54665.1 hypothetical protein COF52_19035 [Bacillus pseudomycoides]